MSELIKLENVGVYFSERKGLFGSRIIKALDSVNLEIRQGGGRSNSWGERRREDNAWKGYIRASETDHRQGFIQGNRCV